MQALAFTMIGVPLGLIAPRATALAVFWALVAFEPTTVDWSSFISDALYLYPRELADALPFTVYPWEMVAGAVTIRLLIAPPAGPRPAVPFIIWLVPLAVAGGYAVGLVNGGKANIGYIEARGLIFAGVTFIAAHRLLPIKTRTAWTLAISSTAVLSLITLSRYFTVTRNNFQGDLAYAHETPVLLAVGMVTGGVAFFSTKNFGLKSLAVLYELLLLVAMVSTGRRAGTLAFLFAGLMFAILIVQHRRVMIPIAIMGLIAFAAYLGAFWNSEFGAIGQPARAIRSQFNPSERDLSSNTYRAIETYDVIATIRLNPVTGVGLGNPFITFIPLPAIGGWTMQFYTPHDNLLWLWLKLGLPGISAVIGVWMLALARAFEAARVRRSGEIPAAAIVCGAAFVVALAYAQVDQFFVNSRALAPFAVMTAVVLILRTQPVPVVRLVTAEERPAEAMRYFPGAI